jgi:hypothetical protein
MLVEMVDRDVHEKELEESRTWSSRASMLCPKDWVQRGGSGRACSALGWRSEACCQ